MWEYYVQNFLESFTKAGKIIDNDHAYIHAGKGFEVSEKISIPSGQTRTYSIKTPSSGYIHYRNERVATSADKVTLILKESATITGGTTLTPVNHNRVSSTTSNVVVKSSVTVSTSGTTVSTSFIGGGTGVGGARAGDDLKVSNEWVLKQNTTYTVDIGNGSSSANDICINMFWYEESNG